jgi:hypothetical protein
VYVDANSSTGAFSNSTNIAGTSGVILLGDTSENMLGNTNGSIQLSGYLYVNESGVVTRVAANTVNGAFDGAINIDSNSGVMIIDSLSDSNMIGNQ